MITVVPYLSFRGNCEEAINTYIRAFGGEIIYLSRWSEKTYKVTPEQIGKVMHVEFALGNTRMAAGDVFEGENINTSIKFTKSYKIITLKKYHIFFFIMTTTTFSSFNTIKFI